VYYAVLIHVRRSASHSSGSRPRWYSWNPSIRVQCSVLTTQSQPSTSRNPILLLRDDRELRANGFATVDQDQLKDELGERRAAVVQELTKEDAEFGRRWLEQLGSENIGSLIGLELTWEPLGFPPEVALPLCVEAMQIRLRASQLWRRSLRV
jgi:hypothetical protein